MTLTASIAFEANDRYLAYFHVDTSAGNVMVWLIEREGAYLMLGRNRTYRDGVMGPESKDTRDSYATRIVATTDEDAVADLQALCDAISRVTARMAPLWGLPQVTFHRFKTGTWAEVEETLRLDSGFTMMVVPEKVQGEGP
jgi:hypothetical protein